MAELDPRIASVLGVPAGELRSQMLKTAGRVTGRSIEMDSEQVGPTSTAELESFFGVAEPQFVARLRLRHAGVEGAMLLVLPATEGRALFAPGAPVEPGEIPAEHPVFSLVAEICEELNAVALPAASAVAVDHMRIVPGPGAIDLGALPGTPVAYQWVAAVDGTPAIAFAHLVGSELLEVLAGVQAADARPAVADDPLVVPPGYTPVKFPQLPADEEAPVGSTGADLLSDLEVVLRVVVGTATRSLREIEATGRGTTYELDRSESDLVDVYVVGARGGKERLLGHGRVIVLAGQKLAIQMDGIVRPDQHTPAKIEEIGNK